MRHHQGPTTPDESLVVRLRELKDRTGLSLAALAARTPYSKSAWHRYLTGTKRPPRPAVEALTRLAGVDPAPVLALWQAADGPPAPSPPAKTGRAESRARLLLTTVTLLGVAAAVTAALALSGRRDPSGTQAVAAPRCHRESCQGRLPDASACARDARTGSRVSGSTYDVRLRYSPSCGTAWSELRMRSPHAREVSVRAGQDVLSAAYPAEDTAGYTSPMISVPSPRGVEACAEVDGELACTGLYVEPAVRG